MAATDYANVFISPLADNAAVKLNSWNTAKGTPGPSLKAPILDIPGQDKTGDPLAGMTPEQRNAELSLIKSYGTQENLQKYSPALWANDPSRQTKNADGSTTYKPFTPSEVLQYVGQVTIPNILQHDPQAQLDGTAAKLRADIQKRGLNVVVAEMGQKILQDQALRQQTYGQNDQRSLPDLMNAANPSTYAAYAGASGNQGQVLADSYSGIETMGQRSDWYSQQLPSDWKTVGPMMASFAAAVLGPELMAAFGEAGMDVGSALGSVIDTGTGIPEAVGSTVGQGIGQGVGAGLLSQGGSLVTGQGINPDALAAGAVTGGVGSVLSPALGGAGGDLLGAAGQTAGQTLGTGLAGAAGQLATGGNVNLPGLAGKTVGSGVGAELGGAAGAGIGSFIGGTAANILTGSGGGSAGGGGSPAASGSTVGTNMANPTIQPLATPAGAPSDNLAAPGTAPTTAPASSGGGVLDSLWNYVSGNAGNLAAFGGLAATGLAEAKSAQNQAQQYAGQLTALGQPYVDTGKATLGTYNQGMAQTAAGQVAGAGAELGIANQGFADYSANKLPPAIEQQLQDQVASQKAALRASLGPNVDSSTLATQYAAIDNQANLNRQQLLDSRLQTAQNSYNQVQGAFTTLLNQAIAAGSTGMAPETTAIQTLIQSDAQISQALNQLFGSIATGYGLSQSGTGGTPGGAATGGVAGAIGSGIKSAVGGAAKAITGGGSSVGPTQPDPATYNATVSGQFGDLNLGQDTSGSIFQDLGQNSTDLNIPPYLDPNQPGWADSNWLSSDPFGLGVQP